jgi:hypothetical protein
VVAYIHLRVVISKEEEEMRKALLMSMSLMIGGVLRVEGMDTIGKTSEMEDVDDLREEQDLHTRTLPPINDDTLFFTKWQVETFITRGESEKIIQTETILVPYPYEEREEIRKEQQVFALVRKYERIDGSTFSEDFQVSPLQERYIGTVDNDQNHRTEKTFEIFPENDPQRVLEVVVRSTPYPFTDCMYHEEIWLPKMIYCQNYNIRTWTKSDGTTLTSKWAIGNKYPIYPIRGKCRGWCARRHSECSPA